MLNLNYNLIAVIFIIVSTNFSYSQKINSENQTESQSAWDLLKYDTNTTFKSVKHSITRPLHWKEKDFAKLGGIVLGTFALSTLDHKTNEFFVKNQEDFPKIIRDAGWYFGSPQNYFITNAGLYGFGLFTKNEKIRKTSVLIISSSITSGFIQTISKTAIGRGRPSANKGNNYFQPFSKESYHHSFPSGHTVLSVTMAHAIAKQLDNTWAKIGVYTLGSIAPISRLVDDAHWLSDIGFSAVLSIIVVDSIDKFLFSSNAYNYKRSPKKISWNVKFGSNQIGIVGTF